MNNLTWVVEKISFNDSDVRDALTSDRTIEVDCVFDGVLQPHIDNPSPCMVYGSTALVQYAYDHGWGPHLYYAPEDFNYNAWLDNGLGELLLNGTYSDITTVGDLKENYSTQNWDWFVRPIGDLKKFNSQLVASSRMEVWAESLAERNPGADIDPDTEVLIAPARKDLLKEYRLFVVDGKIVSQCQYMNEGQLDIRVGDPDNLWWMSDLLSDVAWTWEPARAYVMDIVGIIGGETKIVEFNTINASGLYACDPHAIVTAIDQLEKD